MVFFLFGFYKTMTRHLCIFLQRFPEKKIENTEFRNSLLGVMNKYNNTTNFLLKINIQTTVPKNFT